MPRVSGQVNLGGKFRMSQAFSTDRIETRGHNACLTLYNLNDTGRETGGEFLGILSHDRLTNPNDREKAIGGGSYLIKDKTLKTDLPTGDHLA